MKLAYLATSIIPSRTANSVQVMRMCEAFAENGHEVLLLVPNRRALMESGVHDPFAHYGVQQTFALEHLPWLRLRGRRHIFALLSALRAVRWSADLVYGRNPLGLFWAALLGKRVILEMHGLPRLGTTADRLVYRALARSRRLVHVVAISEELARRLRPYFPRHAVVVAHDGASPHGARKERRAVDSNVPLRVGYVGHLYPGRGVEVVLGLARRFPAVRFELIGGTERDIAQWRERPLTENVSFSGYVPPQEVANRCAGFDVLLMPYQRKVAVHGARGDTSSWMSPLKMFEYMATSKPIISSDLPVQREVLRNGENALLVPPDDLEAWKLALLRLIDDAALRRKLGANARADFEREYTWGSRAAKVLGENETPNHGVPLKILFLIPSLKMGGAEQQAVRYAAGLESRGHRATLCAFEARGGLLRIAEDEGLHIVGLKTDTICRLPSPLRHVAAFARFAVLLRRERPDIVHAFMATANAYGALAKTLLAFRFHLVVSKRNLGLYKEWRPILAHVETWASRRADRVHVNSDAVGRAVLRTERIDPSRLVRIYNGVDTKRFAPRTSILDDQNSNALGGPILAVIAHLHEYKGHETLLQAFPRVLSDWPGACLVLIGDDRGAKPGLVEVVEDLGIQGSVEFLGYQDDIRETLACANLVVHPSLQEGFPNAVLEAMAMGKPIVATCVGGTVEAIEHGVSGLLVKPEDPRALSDAILRVLDDPVLARSLGAAARHRAVDSFSIARILDRLEGLYDCLMQSRSDE